MTLATMKDDPAKVALDPAYAGPGDPGRTWIGDILDGHATGKDVRIRGWIHRTRSKGKLAFLVVRDGTGVIQCTLKQDVLPEGQFEPAAAALMESSLEITGEAKADARAPGGYEIGAKTVRIVHAADIFPIKEQQSTELLMDLRHLWVRSQEQRHIMRVKHHLLRALRDWFHANGFIEVTPSVITQNAAEGGSEVFEFGYFGQPAYLSQTAQMYLEALIFTHEKVYSLTPSFRAEKSRTTRHLTEFSHIEAEMAWMGTDDNMRVQEAMITYAAHTVARACASDLAALGRDPQDLLRIQAPFERMQYSDAVTWLQENGFPDFKWGEDFGAPHERALTATKTQPIFVRDFPKAIKAFYMKENPADPRTVLCDDCIAPEGYGEIVGASEREVSNDEIQKRLWRDWLSLQSMPPGLQKRISPYQGREWESDDYWKDVAFGFPIGNPGEANRPPASNGHWREYVLEHTLSNYAWYLDLRRYGSVRHAGFGLGLERLLQWFTKQEHIRDMTPFPRTTNRAYP